MQRTINFMGVLNDDDDEQDEDDPSLSEEAWRRQWRPGGEVRGEEP